MPAQYGITGSSAKGIYGSVEKAVTEGVLQPGAALPPVRRLADELGLSPGTVSAAYKELRRRGIVVTHGRGGTVVAAAPTVASRRPPKAPEGLYNLASGHPDAAFLPRLVTPTQLPPGTGAHRMSPRLPQLEEAARAWLDGDGVPTEHLTFGHGALDVIARTLSVELRPGDAVDVEDPGYHHLLDLVSALGLRTLPVAVDGDGVRPDALATALRSGARAFVYSPRAQNPCGGSVSAARRDALAQALAATPDVLVIEDDYAADIAGTPLHSLATAQVPRWMHVRSVTKYLGTDLRWAAAACDPTTQARHDGRMMLTSGWVSHLLQATVLNLMGDPAVRGLVAQARDAYAARRLHLSRELDRHGIAVQPASGMNVWIPVRDEAAALNGLRDRGWWAAAGARFRVRSAPGIRVTTALLPEPEGTRFAADLAAALTDSEPAYGG